MLFLYRAEPRTDKKLDLLFWSFEYEKLFKLGVFDAIKNDGGEYLLNRHGFNNQVATIYQPSTLDGILCGGGSYIRKNGVATLGNDIDNRIGVMKIKVVEI